VDDKGLKLWVQDVLVKIATLNQPACLVCEWISLHVMEAAKKMVAELSTQLFVVPGALTSQLQPLDISINTHFEELINEE
jgi:hypothetical protein